MKEESRRKRKMEEWLMALPPSFVDLEVPKVIIWVKQRLREVSVCVRKEVSHAHTVRLL